MKKAKIMTLKGSVRALLRIETDSFKHRKRTLNKGIEEQILIVKSGKEGIRRSLKQTSNFLRYRQNHQKKIKTPVLITGRTKF